MKINPRYDAAENLLYDRIGLFDQKKITHIRHSNDFKPGNYDVILLYNNGKYLVYDNLTIAEDANMIVDMVPLTVQKADNHSSKWLDQRKFTNMLAERTVLHYYKSNDSRHKISGYIFGFDGGSARMCSIRLPADVIKEAFSTRDGYFEFDYEDKDIGLTLRISDDRYYKDLDIELTPNSGYFIALEPEIVPTPIIIGKGGRVRKIIWVR